MKRIWEHDKIAYGGDYNPEQWPEEVWQEDMRLFKKAHIDIVTLNVFSWAALQPSEDEYNFEKLDKIIKLAGDNGLKICLATGTGAHPAWMARKHPEILRTDSQGRKHKFGGRENSCPNSEVYRIYSVRLAEKLAERYGDDPAVIAWHISNEYSGECYCENCAAAFRRWLRKRYKNIDEVNKAWDSAFWGHTFYDFEDIVVPNELSEHFYLFGKERTTFQGISIDYRRFNSESIEECCKLEYDAIRKYVKDTPITTNMMGFYYPLDYHKWAENLDFVSWDSYPGPDEPDGHIALSHELIRGLKRDMPFCLMEQTPSVTNWHAYNKLKRPGDMRRLSYQAVAHGSDSVMFFQMRRSTGACEKYHGAVIDHAGREDTRVFREITELGEELVKIGDKTLGTLQKPKVAVVFDWENWWGISYSAGPSILIDYHEEAYRYYNAFYKRHIPCDIIGTEDSLDRYDIVVAPILYMVKEGYDEKIREFVKNGGSFVTTYFSGYVGDSDLVYGAYPGKLKDILGIWVEESDALPEGEENSFIYNGKQMPARVLCDIIRPEGAEVLARYDKDFYKGEAVITKNSFGKGKAYYMGSCSDEEFYDSFIGDIAAEKGIKGIMDSQEEFDMLDITRRYSEEKAYTFIINHREDGRSAVLDMDGTDILSGKAYKKGERITLKHNEVYILESMI
ncbi:beta-galactosidase [Eubacterium ruminantium]|nr:beta-galactosidase [Eubacterium ruminantium]